MSASSCVGSTSGCALSSRQRAVLLRGNGPSRRQRSPGAAWASRLLTRAARRPAVSAALGNVERARGQDYASAAEVFVEAFFLGTRGKGAEISKGELAYLNGAQKKDMVKRYNQRGLGTMLVVKEDEGRGRVAGCVGVEVQTFVGTVPERRADDNAKGETLDRPVIANLATAPSARRQGLAKRLMAAVEDQCVEWGFDEAVLVVEGSNSKALSLYKKLGYKGIGSEGNTPSLKVSAEGKVVETTVKTVFMRKSLKGGLEGALENLDVVPIVAVAAMAAAAATLLF